MNTVEWARGALVRYRGILSPERKYRLRYLLHPFVNEDADLVFSHNRSNKLPNHALHMDVHAMKSAQKRHYMGCILERSMGYMEAVEEARM